MRDSLEKMIRRKKVITTITSTSTKVEDTEEDTKDDEDTLRQSVVKDLMSLDNRVALLELELELYGRN